MARTSTFVLPWPRFAACLALFILVLTPLLSPAAQAQSTPPGAGFWHTDGTQILDAINQPVRIAGVTWYGMESSHWVPAGLDFQRYTTIMDLVKLLGYNTIRLPFSNELVERNPVVTGEVAANPQFHGMHALDVLDAIVRYAGQIGLKIILDDHRSRAGRPLGINTLDEALWYTPAYLESAWIHDWQTLALRYRGDDTVIGFDLRNEPHTAGTGPWNLDAYLHRSATWGPYKGVDNPATDWRLAAERAGNAVLAINPHLLILVQGLPIYPDASQPGGVNSSWWDGILTPVKRYPVVLQVPHQLVYCVHEWGPRKHVMPWFSPLSARSLARAWDRNWAFILHHPHAAYAAPVLLGEFGTCNDLPGCVADSTPNSQGQWFQLMKSYLLAHPELNWSFYAINGTNSNNCLANNGLLNAAWDNVASLALQATLRAAQPLPGYQPASNFTPLLPGTATTRRPRSATSKLCELP